VKIFPRGDKKTRCVFLMAIQKIIILNSCDTQRSRNTRQEIYAGRPRIRNDEG